jgi:altronate hydrolase
VRFLNAQDCADELAEGAALLDALASQVELCVRAPAPIAKLRIGLKCGGSDGLSGITANPLVGAISDRVARLGGSAVLSEVPEMFGAERLLMNRCVNERVFSETVRLINDFKQYFKDHGQNVYENPSPGNKAGGISTLEDKSLGCTQKGGTSPVRAVLHYGDTVSEPGLNLLEGPGNDLVAITALAAAGAQIILFTTGRGTPVGAPVPTIKIASSTGLAQKKPAWIDFDAGRLLSGESPERLADELFSLVRGVASGEVVTRSEQNGYREIAIFKDGVTL